MYLPCISLYISQVYGDGHAAALAATIHHALSLAAAGADATNPKPNPKPSPKPKPKPNYTDQVRAAERGQL